VSPNVHPKKVATRKLVIIQVQKHLLAITEGEHVDHNLVGLVLPPSKSAKYYGLSATYQIA
jgi:hypothetical protein